MFIARILHCPSGSPAHPERLGRRRDPRICRYHAHPRDAHMGTAVKLTVRVLKCEEPR